jgi:hypothetical protein
LTEEDKAKMKAEHEKCKVEMEAKTETKLNILFIK